MELLLGFVVLGLAVLLFLGTALGLVAYSRQRGLSQRLASVERELARLWTERASAAAPGAQAAATAEPLPRPSAAEAFGRPSEGATGVAARAREGVAPLATELPTPAAASERGAPAPPVGPAPQGTPDAPQARPAASPSLIRDPGEPRAPRRREVDASWSSSAETTGPRGLPYGSQAEPATPPGAGSASSRAPARGDKTDWERWLGVRGAAVVGGIFLALAGILFFQYSIEHGWITPALRVALGTLVGLACFAAGEALQRRAYRMTPGALTGAGAVVLYAAFWAANRLYELWPFALSFALMVAVTVACCLLAMRYSSALVAALGLVGGFATPLLLSTGSDRPVGLFGYVLLLDLGFLFVAGRKRWPGIGLLGLAGTAAIQALWIFERMTPATFAIGMVVLGVFALLFSVGVGLIAGGDRARWVPAEIGAVMLPFAFALYFAQHVDFGERLWPLAALVALLSAAAGWSARGQDVPLAPLGAAAGTAALAAVWLGSTAVGPAEIGELAACAVVLALVPHAFCELAWRRPPETASRSVSATHSATAAAAISAALLLAVLVAAGAERVATGPYALLAAELALVALLARQAALSGSRLLAPWGSLLLGVGLAVWGRAHGSLPGSPSPLGWGALLVATSTMLQLFALARREPAGRRAAALAAWAFHVPAVFAFVTAGLLGSRAGLDSTVAFAAFVLAGAVAAAFARSGPAYAQTVALGSIPLLVVHRGIVRAAERAGELPQLAAVLLALVVALAAWPLVARARFAGGALAARAGALAPLLFYPAIERTVEVAWGRSSIALLPLGLAALGASLAARWIALGRDAGAASPDDARALRLGAVWCTASACLLASLALPLHFERGELPVTLALFGAAIAVAWRRFDHPPLKYLAAAALATSTLVQLEQRTFTRHAPYPHPLVNWLAYDFLLPAAAALAATIAVGRLEVARLRDVERRTFGPRPAAAGVLSLCAIVLAFGWLNLAILNFFGEAPQFRIAPVRVPERDLTVSIAWALYALMLLGLGVQRRLSGLRWASLMLLIATIGKVFLFDLGNLGGLYRVASLLGLALSLLFVSLLYQRFVFRRPAADPASP